MAAGGKQENIIFVIPDRTDETIAELPQDGRPLLLVDVSVHTEEAVVNLRRIATFQVIDHHHTARWLAGKQGFIIDTENSACGCEMFRRWLVQTGFDEFDTLPWRRFTLLIDDYDRWKKRDPDSMRMARFFSLIGGEEWLKRINPRTRFLGSRDVFSPAEDEFLRISEAALEARLKRTVERFIVQQRRFGGVGDVKIAYIISGEANVSELLMRYLDEHPEVDVACQINPDRNTLSLRSKGKVDITKLAAVYGGGGHRDAGGHPLPDGFYQSIIEQVHGR